MPGTTDNTGKAGKAPLGPFATVSSDLPEARALRSAGFAILRQGRRATAEQLARSAGLEADRTRRALAAMADRGATELDEDGNVVGIGGLSLVPTHHELLLDGVPLYTWCAFDALGIPPAAGVDAHAQSRCGHCGRTLGVAFAAGEPQGTPEVITWFPLCETAENVRRDFCDSANLFCNRDHLDTWRAGAGKPAGEALTIAAVAERGRINWSQDIPWMVERQGRAHG